MFGFCKEGINMSIEEEIQEKLEEVKKQINLSLVEQLLTNNTHEFQVKDDTYRVTRPTFAQKKAINGVKMKELNRLLRDPDCLFEKDIIELLKTKGVDIPDLDNQLKVLETQKEKLQISLGEVLAKKENEADLHVFKEEIEKIDTKQQTISFQKAFYLENTIENQVTIEIYCYTSYLITEKAVEESGQPIQWIKPWKDYDDFINSSEELVNAVTFYATIISQGNTGV